MVKALSKNLKSQLSLDELHQFVSKAQKGDKSAYYEVFKRMKPMIFKQGNLILGGMHNGFSSGFHSSIEWDEHLNNLYIEIYKCINNFDFSRNAKFTYFAAVCIRNYFFNWRAKLKRTLIKEESINKEIGDDLELEDALLSDDATPDKLFEINEGNKKLMSAVLKLSKKQKRIIYLCFFKDMSMVEASKVLDIHYQTEVGLKRRALKELRCLCGEL